MNTTVLVRVLLCLIVPVQVAVAKEAEREERHDGHYDIARDWTGSHRNHRAGEDTDIGLSPIARHQARLRCLYQAIVDHAGLRMPVSSEALVVVNPRTGRVRATGDHVHLWTGEQRIYDQDLSAQVQSQLSCLLFGTCQ